MSTKAELHAELRRLRFELEELFEDAVALSIERDKFKAENARLKARVMVAESAPVYDFNSPWERELASLGVVFNGAQLERYRAVRAQKENR